MATRHGYAADPILCPSDQKGKLVLEDGTVVEGISFGADVPVAGELVFNTGMVGYPEALTDPSYRGQILVLTFPLVGNYGVPSNRAIDEFGLPKYFESDSIHITGLVVAEYNADHSHWNSNSSLGEWLQRNNIPAIYGVDTRMLTKRIRDGGATLAKLEFPGHPPLPFSNPNLRNLVAEVSLKVPRVFNRGARPRIVAIDCGMKYNIMRCFARRGVELTVVPYDYDFEAHPEEQWDGVFVSNGPGDPSMCLRAIESLRRFILPALGNATPADAAASAAAAAAVAAATVAEESAAAPRPEAAAPPPPAAASSSELSRWSGGKRPTPVFGICLGNQLLALAAGGSTYKMKYGNRGMNQPAVDMRTTRCFITPQNHGYAVAPESLPAGWKALFINANDGSNEGIIHSYLPYFSVQFHPEANGGPLDTAFLFDLFLEQVSGVPPSITTVDSSLYLSRVHHLRRKVLLLGSGGLSIGQAGEFDYSGSQAIKALKEEGVEVVLINPNIATVQTSKGMADRVYFLPVTHDFVLEVLRKERPDGILISMGGQTALNVGLSLHRSGDLAALGCAVLGTPVAAVETTEDRELFARMLASIGETVAKCVSTTTVEGALEAAREIGYPVLVRAAYALGGLGSGFAEDEEELRTLATRALASSDQLLIDQDLRGWKEIEYEVVRDVANNCVTVCNMENFDPLGVHTGDSIVVAPSQTLSNTEYHKLRMTALKVVRHLGIVGECNIQYALHPDSERYCIIEVNARLSRSSALASKATGYPLAYVATKLALGHDLVSLRNSVTKTTTACFEPSLDYVVVKVPRWDLRKFGARVDTSIGSAMKSVGEVMSIGRTFEEAIQKAVRMVNTNLDGFGPPATYEADWAALAAAKARAAGAGPATARAAAGGDGDARVVVLQNEGATGPRAAARRFKDDPVMLAEIDRKLKQPSDTRLWDIAIAFDVGYSVDRVHELSRIDRWFLSKLRRIMDMSHALEQAPSLHALPPTSLRHLKRAGFGDRQIARLLGDTSEMAVRRARIAAGILPVVKQIDTLAAEFPAQTNYLYMTYHGSENDVAAAGEGVMVLGSGPYCIGSSVEFDWCAVSCVRSLRASGLRAIVVNYNPETVSTDYDECDRLYFEELSLERVLDIYEREAAAGVIVSVGGQIPQNLAIPLHRQGVRILGTSPVDIDRAEDRGKFSKLLDSIGVDQPPWQALASLEGAKAFATTVGYPVLVRPSYVLSGAAMSVAATEAQLVASLSGAALVSQEHPVVVSKFIVNAKEVEFDAVAKDGVILNYAISEHVENAGVHSGDATLVLPAQKLYVETIRQVKKISSAIARALSISGPFNIQFMSRENEVKVIECNLRASRTFPFISKTFDYNFISLATRVMVGLPPRPGVISLVDLDYVGIKAPMFSFTRLQGSDPTLGVEMMSTGEVACFGVDMYEAFLLSMMSAGLRMPNRTRAILFSLGAAGKAALTESIKRLQALGYGIYATEGTRQHLEAAGMTGVTELAKPSAAGTSAAPQAVEWLREKRIDLVINDPAESPDTAGGAGEDTDGFLIRRTAVDFGVSLVTNMKCAALLAMALERVKSFHIRSMEEFYAQKDAALAVLDGSSYTAGHHHEGGGGGGGGLLPGSTFARAAARNRDAAPLSPHRTPSKTGAGEPLSPLRLGLTGPGAAAGGAAR